ncbi:Bacterial regulatory protein, arsR family [uncultured archaeon]|nr:Bacterial regulatory protein, arsR family [uncultured archaeon]
MKCCPKDKDINREWITSLERESSNIQKDRVIEICNFCKVFSNPLRVNIALLLSKRDLCVCEIVSILGEKQNLVSHHLSIMKRYGVIGSYNQSKYKYYKVERTVVDFLETFKGNFNKYQ